MPAEKEKGNGDILRDRSRKIVMGSGDYIEGDKVGGDIVQGPKIVYNSGEHPGESRRRPARVTADASLEDIRQVSSWEQEQLQKNYDQTRGQAQSWSRLGMGVAVVGFAVIAAGVLVGLSGQASVAVVTSLAGVISEGVAFLFFRQSNAANKRTDAIQKQLTEWQQIDNMMGIINTITDAKARNNLREEIVRKIMGLQKQN